MKIKQKINDIAWWIKYRTTHRYHVVKTGLGPGYYDCDTVILHTNFTILVNYVEGELASKMISMVYDQRKNLYPIPWYWFDNFQRRVKLHPHAGLHELRGEMTSSVIDDDPMTQAFLAREAYILYHWWRHIRPNRPTEYNIGRTDEEVEIRRDLIINRYEINKNYDKEDEDMLYRLIKIRGGLWI